MYAAEGPVDAITVAGVQYAYEGIREAARAGSVVSFQNDGNEVHVIVVVRRDEGVTTTLEDLLAMPEAESEQGMSRNSRSPSDAGS